MRPNKPRQGGRPAPQPVAPTAIRSPAPYHFVPVEPNSAVLGDTPTHDVLDVTDSCSGELHCTLTALTPLLAANDQYSFKQARKELQTQVEAVIAGRFPNRKLPGKIADDKKILEPLTDTREGESEPGPVLIAGAGFKGMLRQSLGALLAAPMERVMERSSSYRPNVKTLTRKHNPIRSALPALVVGGGGFKDGKPQPIRLLMFRDLVGTVSFVHPDAVAALPQRVRDLLNETDAQREHRYSNKQRRDATRLTASEAASIHGVGLSLASILKPGGPNSPTALDDWLPVKNLNGIDLIAELNRRFHELNPELAGQLSTKSPGGYPLLFLDPDQEREEMITEAVLQGFYDSLDHLANGDGGHLRAHPLLNSSNEIAELTQHLRALRARGLRAGDIVFLEKTGNKVTSLGHHFYYRWRYRSTVHTTPLPADRGDHVQSAAPQLRDVLCPRPPEMTPGKPTQLSAARALFGYVGTNKGEYKPAEPTTFGIGMKDNKQTDFHQLAGRVSVNLAVEQEADKRKLEDRFLNARGGCLVPLRPLGLPRPSAVEHYLTQDRLDQRGDGGILCTYGDTPDDQALGRLRGRKFYLHQPDAADPNKANCYELTDQRHPDWLAGTKEMILSDQAVLARFVSKPGTRFRFAVRFTNLKPWELGALLFVLSPTIDDVRFLRDKLPESARAALARWLSKVEQKGWDKQTNPLLAHKLGHGRPLGLGSVTVAVDRLRRIVLEEELPAAKDHAGDALATERKKLLTAFVEYLVQALPGKKLEAWVERCLVPWLQVHRYAGRSRFDYPRRSEKGTTTIFNYHSQLRGQHAEGRKRGKPPGKMPRQGLPELDELDELDG